MAKRQTLRRQKGSQEHVPFRQVVYEDTSARLEHPDALTKPFLAPAEVLVVGAAIVRPQSILFSEIKGRISKHHINHAILHGLQELQTITLKQCTPIRRVKRVLRCQKQGRQHHCEGFPRRRGPFDARLFCAPSDFCTHWSDNTLNLLS